MEEESGDAGTHVGKDLRWYKSETSINRLVALVVKNLPANAGDTGDVSSIPGWERSPGGGCGNPLQYSCLENPMDIEEPGGLKSMGVTKSRI